MRTGLRRACRLFALTASLIACLIPHLLWRIGGLRSPWPRYFLRLAAYSVGARIRIKGAPRQHDVFFIANHLSWIDILALGGTTGAAFISHDGVAGWPLVGWLARQNRTIFVARSDRHAVREQINALRTALEGHQPVALFPEGTTGDGSSLLPFKPALLAGLMPPPRELDVQPVWIDYGEATTEIAWHSDEPAGANALRLLSRKGTLPVTLHFLEPFDPEDCPDRKAVADAARNLIQKRQSASLRPPATI